jgi:hypothetical protein
MILTPSPIKEPRLKDDALFEMAHRTNVAQFVSFNPDGQQRHSAVLGCEIDASFNSSLEAIELLLARSVEGRVNVRSFHPDHPKSLPFIYGLEKASDASEAAAKLGADGLYTIVNETIDVNDGGVSGVSLGGIIEFSPDDTPRCVERPGTVSLSAERAVRLLKTVYSIAIPQTPFLDSHTRVEFSIHPLRQGYRESHVICWEIEEVDEHKLDAHLRWPNNFSRKIGDKAFGLLMADLFGFRVPRTTVVPRALAPFSFGADTGSSETWMRTCPVEPEPGKFSTTHGWSDPFQTLAQEDPAGSRIASILAQRGVTARYSGATIPSTRKDDINVEGVSGVGEDFMLGQSETDKLPASVTAAIADLANSLSEHFGRTRMEWVHDGTQPWILQLHQTRSRVQRGIIYPGSASEWVTFEPSDGLDALRQLIRDVKGTGVGVLVVGGVGATSHVGDLLRRAKIPSRLANDSFGLQQTLFQE